MLDRVRISLSGVSVPDGEVWNTVGYILSDVECGARCVLGYGLLGCEYGGMVSALRGGSVRRNGCLQLLKIFVFNCVEETGATATPARVP